MVYTPETYQKYKVSIIEAKKRYYEKNKDTIKQKQKEYDDLHREVRKEKYKLKKEEEKSNFQ